ncbi:MAG: hypothetical protein WAU32_07485, partial [Thermoanaerobaculia bacterium]
RGRAATAEDTARRALAKAEAVGWGAGLYRLHALLARTLEARGQTQAAKPAWERGLAALERLEEGLTQPQRAALRALPEVREIESKGAAPAASRS